MFVTTSIRQRPNPSRLAQGNKMIVDVLEPDRHQDIGNHHDNKTVTTEADVVKYIMSVRWPTVVICVNAVLDQRTGVSRW